MVKKRNIIGLFFTGSYNWVGGLYYIINIVKSIQFLPENEQPKVIIFYGDTTPTDILSEVCFSYTKLVNINKLNSVEKGVFKILKLFSDRNFQMEYFFKKYKVNFIYPFNTYTKEFRKIKAKKASIIYDFQHKILPGFFSTEELNTRDFSFNELAKNAPNIVFSSKNARSHFQQFYAWSKTNPHVLQFASVFDTEKLPNKEQLMETYKIPTNYFLVSNQFWQHKNHEVVLRAISRLNEMGLNPLIVFTGKNFEDRNPYYFESLTKIINDNKIENNVRFLGFIPRTDQLGLMKYAIAIIQPSKFEGWGTVVEDAKTLGKHVILSDIPVHREQMLPFYKLFHPDDDSALTEHIVNLINENQTQFFNTNNPQRFAKFANDFIQIVNKCVV